MFSYKTIDFIGVFFVLLFLKMYTFCVKEFNQTIVILFYYKLLKYLNGY